MTIIFNEAWLEYQLPVCFEQFPSFFQMKESPQSQVPELVIIFKTLR